MTIPYTCQDERFRQDLFYRLRVIEIRIPPLRERRHDVLALARSSLADVAARMRLPVTGFTPAAADQLLRWGWPGNVRELQNVVERAAVLARGTRIDVDDPPDEVRQAVPGVGHPGSADSARWPRWNASTVSEYSLRWTTTGPRQPRCSASDRPRCSGS